MKVDITQLLIIFDELLPCTDEELGDYWFQITRNDGVIIRLIFSIYEDNVIVCIYLNSETVASRLCLEECSEIRVLDEQKKCLEILHQNDKGRCFLSLVAGPIMEYKE